VAERMIEANGVELCTEPFGRFVSTARVDWSDHDSVIEYLVDYQRLLAGGRREFDEEAAAADA